MYASSDSCVDTLQAECKYSMPVLIVSGISGYHPHGVKSLDISASTFTHALKPEVLAHSRWVRRVQCLQDKVQL